MHTPRLAQDILYKPSSCRITHRFRHHCYQMEFTPTRPSNKNGQRHVYKQFPQTDANTNRHKIIIPNIIISSSFICPHAWIIINVFIHSTERPCRLAIVNHYIAWIFCSYVSGLIQLFTLYWFLVSNMYLSVQGTERPCRLPPCIVWIFCPVSAMLTVFIKNVNKCVHMYVCIHIYYIDMHPHT